MPNRTPLLSPQGKAVVITGASSGLGEACARHLARVGFQVYAGVRRTEDAERLAASGAERLTPVILDVTDEATIRDTADRIAEETADTGLFGLVNNAGIAVTAPLECVSPQLLRRQLDTNVVGQLAVIQGLLPLLRTGAGRIVNITSGLGNVAIPYMGAYAAAQFAKEALSDALRRELAPFGIPVSVVQPGAIMTPIWDKMSLEAAGTLDGAPEAVSELYRDTFLRFLETNEHSARTSGTTADDVARTVMRALVSRRPRTRYGVGKDATGGRLLARLLPDRAIDKVFGGIVTATAS
ncbi:SDR family oxidoreductase [Streptomyces sp. NPDC032472]|uniref:SDR family oxidoreductase n=1 Tax=Streptomyces sp. NPDC032472 TaxID=3155018 RepID=UPI0033C1DA3C